jgi:uncharacterized protein (TIGR00725 family)
MFMHKWNSHSERIKNSSGLPNPHHYKLHSNFIGIVGCLKYHFHLNFNIGLKLRKMYNIGVIGGSTADDSYRPIAYEVGKLLAKKKATVFCGGLGGVMEWVSRGVSENNGIVVGILPGYLTSEGNQFLSIRMPTGIGYMRNFLIVRASEALIAIDGSSGTLSEASFAITEGKTVVSIGEMEIDHRKPGDGIFVHASDPMEAVDLAIHEAEKYRSSPKNQKDLTGY